MEVKRRTYITGSNQSSYDQRTYISDSGSQVVLEQLPDNNFTNDVQHNHYSIHRFSVNF